MIKLKIRKRIKDSSIIEEVIDFNGTYDGKILTHVPDSTGHSYSWIPMISFDDFEVIEQVLEQIDES